MTKEEIDILIGVLKSVIVLAEKIDPDLENNTTVIAITKGISFLQGMGL